MKKLLLALVLIQFVGTLSAQTLQKGNLVGTHLLDLELKPGVTIEQFQEFYIDKVIPEFEKSREGWKLYLVKWIRGENKDRYGLLMIIESEEARDKHYNEDNSLSEFGKSAIESFMHVREELDKLVTISAKYTDWLVL